MATEFVLFWFDFEYTIASTAADGKNAYGLSVGLFVCTVSHSEDCVLYLELKYV